MSSSSRRRADGQAPPLAALLLVAVLLQAVWAVEGVASAAGRLAVAAVLPSTVDHQVSLVATVSPAPPAAPRSEDFVVSVGDTRVPSAATPVLSPRLALAVVVDGSSAAWPALQGAVSGATNLLLQLPTSARSTVVVDTGPPVVRAPLSEGPAGAVGALSALRPGGERRTAQALTLALKQLPRDAGTPRVVLVATGATDAGGEPAAELGRRLREARVLLAVVGTGPDQRFWTQVARETGGLVVDGSRSTPTAATDAVAAGLRERYLVTFALPELLPAPVALRLDTAEGPLTATATVPAPSAAPAPAPAPASPAPVRRRGGLVGALVVVALAAGVGVLVGVLRRRARRSASAFDGVPAEASSGGRSDPAAGTDQAGHAPPAAPRPRRGRAADQSAYRHLDAEVGRAATAVQAGRLDLPHAVARIALAAPGRPDLLDRVVDTERRMAGSWVDAAPSTSAVLDLLAAARSIVTGEARLLGPDGVRVELAEGRLRLTRDDEPPRDFDSVAELARHVDVDALAGEPSAR